MQRSNGRGNRSRRRLSAKTAYRARNVCWGAPLRELVASCDDFVERPIYQLPLGFTWEHRSGVLLIGDAVHLMPPLGAGVNLAMLDASVMAMTIVAGGDWHETTRAAQKGICQRGSC